MHQLGLLREIYVHSAKIITTHNSQSWQGMEKLFVYPVCYLADACYIRKEWCLSWSFELCTLLCEKSLAVTYILPINHKYVSAVCGLFH